MIICKSLDEHISNIILIARRAAISEISKLAKLEISNLGETIVVWGNPSSWVAPL